MPARPKITIKLVDKKGPCACHHGHKIGDSFNFDTDRGKICPMAMHVAFVYADILRYGGTMPRMKDGAMSDPNGGVRVVRLCEIMV